MIRLSFSDPIDRVKKDMTHLGRVYHENTLFVSQHVDNGPKDASILVGLACPKEESEEYLALRRLFAALEYRFNEQQHKYKVKIKLDRKAKR